MSLSVSEALLNGVVLLHNEAILVSLLDSGETATPIIE